MPRLPPIRSAIAFRRRWRSLAATKVKTSEVSTALVVARQTPTFVSKAS
jgi:hypothetical protein